MYRESHEGLHRTIDRLEGELYDLTSVRRRSHERTLWLVTAMSLLCAAAGFLSATGSRAHAREVEQRLWQTEARLGVKTRDLYQCLDLARSAP
jgi:hypothetical protein